MPAKKDKPETETIEPATETIEPAALQEVEAQTESNPIVKLETKMTDLALSLCDDAKDHRSLNLNELDRVNAIINLHDALIRGC